MEINQVAYYSTVQEVLPINHINKCWTRMLHATPHPLLSSVAILMFTIASSWRCVKFSDIGYGVTSFFSKMLKVNMYENSGKYILLKGTGEALHKSCISGLTNTLGFSKSVRLIGPWFATNEMGQTQLMNLMRNLHQKQSFRRNSKKSICIPKEQC